MLTHSTTRLRPLQVGAATVFSVTLGLSGSISHSAPCLPYDRACELRREALVDVPAKIPYQPSVQTQQTNAATTWLSALVNVQYTSTFKIT